MRRLAMIVLATSLVLAVAGVTTAPGAFAAPAYEIAVAAPAAGGSPGIYRIDVATGQVMRIRSQLVPTVDAAPLPQGDYHLLVTETIDKTSYWTYRLDSQSGRVWFLMRNAWTEVTAAK
jgi:hypothetical protein